MDLRWGSHFTWDPGDLEASVELTISALQQHAITCDESCCDLMLPSPLRPLYRQGARSLAKTGSRSPDHFVSSLVPCLKDWHSAFQLHSISLLPASDESC